jgi:ketosteroid isomerase-like protein
MKKINSLLAAALLASAFVLSAAFFIGGCNDNAPVKEEPKKEETVTPATAAAVTNPNFSIAPVEYAELGEKALGHFAKFEYDAWAEMLADNVTYVFPDGDLDTRTKIEGKAAVLAWWKTWKEKSGIQSMTMIEFNHFPLNVTAQPKGGALMGNYDFCYFSNKMVFAGKPVAVRMNFIAHFNADKKIDRYITYYDRSVIIKATGKNVLEEMKAKK